MCRQSESSFVHAAESSADWKQSLNGERRVLCNSSREKDSRLSMSDASGETESNQYRLYAFI